MFNKSRRITALKWIEALGSERNGHTVGQGSKCRVNISSSHENILPYREFLAALALSGCANPGVVKSRQTPI